MGPRVPRQAHPASSENLKLRSNRGNRESRWCLQTTRLSHISSGSLCHPLFLPPHFSPCRNSPSSMPAAWPRWLLPGRLFLFFKSGFFSPRHLWTHYSILECFPRGTGCCALICYCETWFVTLSCCTCIPTDSLHFRFCCCPCCDTSW